MKIPTSHNDGGREAFHGEFSRMVSNRAGAIAGKASAMVTIAFAASLVVLDGGSFVINFVFIASLAFTLGIALLSRTPRLVRVGVRVDEAGIWTNGELLLRRGDIGGGTTQTSPDGIVRVIIVNRRAPATGFLQWVHLVLVAPHSAKADALLHAVGVDAGHQTLKMTLFRYRADGHTLMATLVHMTLYCSWSWTVVRLSLHGALTAGFSIALAAATILSLLVQIARLTVTVGRDGILLRKGFARDRFLRIDEIRCVSVRPAAVTILLHIGEKLVIAGHSSRGLLGASDVEVLGERIRGALAHHQRLTRSLAALVAVDRGARSADEWFTSLRAIGRGRSDYRSSVVRIEDLCQVLADTMATSNCRIGAAVALRIADSVEGHAKIRVAAKTTACAELGSALAEIADETEEVRLFRHLTAEGAGRAPFEAEPKKQRCAAARATPSRGQ